MKIISAFFLLMIAACSKKSGGSGTGNNTLPTVTINSISQSEGNTGTTAFVFTLTLSKASASIVTVSYSTLEGSAKATEDYAGFVNQSVSFQPNELTKTITVNVVADDAREADDEFSVMLTGATGASIYEFKGTAVITNDDLRVPFTNAGYDAPTTYAGYTLAWADEFNSGSLDAAAWTLEGGDGCPSICGWGNNELEYYTGRPENLFFQDGKLLIEARKESFGGKNYTSSKIVSRGKKIFKFGRIDIRAKLPKGKGIWPALWMLPQSNVYGGWPTSGEIDIMELVGHEPNKAYATMHYGPGPGSISISRGYTLPSGIYNDEFHVFSIEWKPDQIKCYVDGNLFSTILKADVGANTYPFNENFFFIMNLAVGGNWPGSPDGSTNFPQWMAVDYVRVYQ